MRKMQFFQFSDGEFVPWNRDLELGVEPQECRVLIGSSSEVIKLNVLFKVVKLRAKHQDYCG